MNTAQALSKEDIIENIDALGLLKNIEDEIISWRRELHQMPEIGLDLPKTSKFVQDRLDELEIDYELGVGSKYAIVASIDGAYPGDTIAFRADMDGLPVVEDTGLDFQSTNGCMHACGHDAHTAILLGAAKVISQNRDRINGRIVLIFQPGEEDSTGARPIAKSGILEDYNVQRIFGLHVGGIGSGRDKGKLFLNPGPMMACLDSFKMEIKGRGSHGAYPDKSIDPITMGSYIVTGLQEIISREIDPTEPGVITIGSFQAGSAYNVIPDSVKIEGTARAVTEEQRRYIASRIGEVANAIATGFRGSVDYNYTFGAPPLVNDRESTMMALGSAQKVLGKENIILTNKPVMGGEDFAEYLERVPGSFMFFENMMEIDGKIHPHHNPKFALDEASFIEAASVFVQLALDN